MRLLKLWFAGLVAGLVLVSGALAGVSLAPVGSDGDRLSREHVLPGRAVELPSVVVGLAQPAPGEFLVGAGKVSMVPDPPAGRVWKTEGCQVLSNPGGWEDIDPSGTTWPADPDCIYLGGYNIGPVRPATGVSDLGVWAKALAVSDGSNTVVYGNIDGVGYFYKYTEKICADCGIRDVKRIASARIVDEIGMDVDLEAITFSSSHSHAAPDFLFGWGGVPDWYLRQARDAMVQAAVDAVASLAPATIHTGDVVVRQRNVERRDLYRSPVDNQLVWLRARHADSGDTIATVINYAGHPTSLGSGNRTIHPDWPGLTEARLEQDGGVAMFLPGGLGNTTFRGGLSAGTELAELALADMDARSMDAGAGSTQVAAISEEFHQPVTNVPLAVLGGAGLFDRAIELEPASGSWQQSENRPCASGSPASILTAMGGYRIGDVALMFGPGELFANLTASVKSRLGAAQVMVGSLANDELGYIIQSFEFDEAGQQGLGFVGEVVEYEEAFSLDRCFGDRVVEGLLRVGGQLGF